MDRIQIEETLRHFPYLFKLVNGELFFQDETISTCSYTCARVLNTYGHPVYNILASDALMVVESLWIRYSVNTVGERHSTYMTLPRGSELPEETLVNLFEMNMGVQYCIDPLGEYRFYDYEAIMRRHRIKNIIDHEE